MVLFFLFLALASSSLPVVLWHGMGDDCCNPSSMGAIKSWIENLTSSYVLSLRIGDNSIEDTINGFLKPAGEQVSEACSIVSQDPKLVNGFNAVGFSQGSQFLRSLVQTCNVTVNNLITLGAQHQGVFGLPDCLAKDSFACREARSLIDDFGVYSEFVQHHSTQANYWHDAEDENRYLKGNLWLPKVNGHPFDPVQKSRLTQVNKFVMVKFENDTMVQPRESSWFGFYKKGSTTVSVPLNETSLFTDPQDALGLRQMSMQSKLVFLQITGEHLQFNRTWFENVIIKGFLI